MSQYLNKTLINYILIHALISVTFGENQTLNPFTSTDWQNSDQNFSSLFHTNSYLSTKYIHKNIGNTDGYNTYKRCNNKTSNCDGQDLCCPIDETTTMCIHSIQPRSKCKGQFNANCTKSSDCESILGLKCFTRKTKNINEEKGCICPEGKWFDYDSTKLMCVDDSNDPNTAMQIYKITMIFASCCLALILIIFLVCILRKSYCPPRQPITPLDNSTIPDIFTLFPHVGNYDGGPLGDGTLPPFEKPPTYDETLTLIRNEIGIPPPAYRRNPNSSSSSNSSNQSTPNMSSRVLVSRPVLTPVTDTSNSYLTNSSSSETSIAGPSGECPGSGGSHQGIDNPAFC